MPTEQRSCFLHGDYTGRETCPGCQPAALPAVHAEKDEAPICAQHEVSCEEHWVCPICINENAELDAAVGELREAHEEIRDLRAAAIKHAEEAQ